VITGLLPVVGFVVLGCIDAPGCYQSSAYQLLIIGASDYYQ
jgi:hypothetical protein